jgi:dUTP pyrophosphatase
MKVEFRKLHQEARTPTRAHLWDAGLDFYATRVDLLDRRLIYHTGIAVSIPPGYAGLLFMRSSVRDTRLILANAVGLVDPGFQGEIVFTYRELDCSGIRYQIGEKCGQLFIIERPAVELEEVTDFSVSTARGEKGHGSSGR